MLSLLAVTSWLLASTSAHAEKLSQQQKLKAAYLFNFTRFIEWHDEDFDLSKRAVNICMNQSRAFKDFLESIVKGRRVGYSKKPINIKKFAKGDKNRNCHVSFIASAADAKAVANNKYLKVADNPDLKDLGAAINFYEKNARVRFEIYPSRLDQQGANLSSELLKLARIVEE